MALKGFGAVPIGPKDIEYVCQDFAHNVTLIAENIRLGDGATQCPIIELIKELENFLVVLEHSKVPTVILSRDSLDFFQTVLW